MKVPPGFAFDVLGLLGVTCIVAGVAMWSVPAALVIFGLGLLAAGLQGAKHSAARDHGTADPTV